MHLFSARWRWLTDSSLVDRLGFRPLIASCIQHEAAMTPFEIVSLILAIITLVIIVAFGSIQIGKWIGEKK